MAVEFLTFKEISTLFSNLKLSSDTQIMEAHFGWKFPLLKSWFRNVSDLRNLCAHHSRVWNRDLVVYQKLHGKILTTGHLFRILFLSQQKQASHNF